VVPASNLSGTGGAAVTDYGGYIASANTGTGGEATSLPLGLKTILLVVGGLFGFAMLSNFFKGGK
jgi:hypothetical protein